MSSTYIPADLRRQVIERANGLCEYCLIHEDDTYFGCQVDHIISEKHYGPTEADNLVTAIGKATAQILQFNHIERLLERLELQELGRYPSFEALAIIS